MHARLITPGIVDLYADGGGHCIGVGINPDPGNPNAKCWLGYLPGWKPE